LAGMLAFRVLLLAVVVAKVADAQLYTREQEYEIGKAAEKYSFDASKCTGMDEPMTDTERIFASDGHLKFFAYDTNHIESWALLQNLQTCLETVSGHDWLGGQPNLWEAAKQPYIQFATGASKEQWNMKAEYTENNPTNAKDTVVGSNSASLMSSFKKEGTDLWFQQPCNAFSNAAFLQLALSACSGGMKAINGWTWEVELKAASNLLAFGSFAMHSTPVSDWNPVSTQFLDVIGMQAYFYLLHQATVHQIVSSTAAAADKTILLKLGQEGHLADARTAIHDLTRIFTQDPSTWRTAEPIGQVLPAYMASAVGTVLVALRALLHDEIFGTAVSVSLYELICNGLVDALLGGDAGVKGVFCAKDSAWFVQLNAVPLKAPKNLEVGMGLLLSSLQIFIEAMFWQETKAAPSNYLEKWTSEGVIGPTISQCWLMPHSTWHRICGLTVQKLSKLISDDLPTAMLEPPLTAEQKKTSWSNAPAVAAQLKTFVDSFVGLKKADTVNLCRVFGKAKECASKKTFSEDKQCKKPAVRSFLDPDVLNEYISKAVQALDPIEIDEEEAGDLKDPLNICKFQYTFKLTHLKGLADCWINRLDVKTAYAEGSTPEGTAIRASVSASTCPITIQVGGEATVTRDGYITDDNWIPDINLGQCNKMVTKVGVNATLEFYVDTDITADVNLHTILGGIAADPASSAFAVAIDKLDLHCEKIANLDIQINDKNFNFLAGTLKGTFNLGAGWLACKALSPKLKKEVQKEVTAAAETMGSSGAASRRLQACRNPSNPTAAGMLGLASEAFAPAPWAAAALALLARLLQ